MELMQALNWRYATKTFDASKKVSDDVFANLMEAARLAPSSYGLELWKFVVVDNAELRAKIREVAWNQGQVTDASHLVVLCRQATATADDVEKFVKYTAEVRGMDVSALDGYKQMMLGAVAGMDEDKKANWMGKQVYLALGFLLAAAAEAGVDACPMEGFDPTKVDEILGLDKMGLKSVVLCPVGYRSAEDKYGMAKKVRKPASEVVVHI